jgi:Cu2+-exporting ATPase
VTAVCYHCGLPVADPQRWTVQIQQQHQPMCCPGCQAVASAIVQGGFDQYYRFRSEMAPKGEFDKQQDVASFQSFDDPESQKSFVISLGVDEKETRLVMDDIHCAACCWLIENALQKLPGVTYISVNLGSHRATLRWQPSRIKLAAILKNLHQVGYRALPFRTDSLQDTQDKNRRMDWLRLGVAAMVMMQAGMFSFALYYSDFSYMAADHRRMLQVFGLLMTAPVMFFSAVPFFKGAWRSLRARQPGMDVPVSLALWVAFLASLHAAATGRGDVYFDSISMFVFLLLLARFAESSARRNFFAAELASLLPFVCHVCPQGTKDAIDKRLSEVSPGEHIRVFSGEVIPFDGVIIEGQGSINESAFSGESLPLLKKQGDPVYAGTLNGDGVLVVEVQSALGQARIDVIGHLAERSESQKPDLALLADRIAKYFTWWVLALAALSGVFWWWQDADRTIAIMIAVLVVSCPCALSLATPSALAFCYQALRKQGLWVISGQLLERIKTIDTVVFDKTGTLTRGEFRLQSVQLSQEAIALGMTDKELGEIAAALESVSRHPMASAFRSMATDLQVSDIKIQTGAGLEGVVEGCRYYIGRQSYVEELSGQTADFVIDPACQQIYLASEQALLACFSVQDALREDAAATVHQLQARGLQVLIFSGDRSGATEKLAQSLGIKDCRSGMSPEQKLAGISELQAQGHRVMMVGDGMNDIPVLAKADVSVAMNKASDFAKVKSDGILLQDNLLPLLSLVRHGQKTRRIIQQNYFWALLYNGISLPAAAMGYVPPWVAAIGMSLSSLLVTFNSMRLRRIHS